MQNQTENQANIQPDKENWAKPEITLLDVKEDTLDFNPIKAIQFFSHT